MTFEVAILLVFRIFPNWNCNFRPGLWKAGCDVAMLYVLQSYRSCTFCKRKTRGETQSWIELAALCTLANHNEIKSDDTLPFIIFLTPVSCDGSNRLWRQRLLLSPLISRPTGVRELRKIQLWLCQFILIRINLSRCVSSGNDILVFYTTLYPSFCDDFLMLGTLKPLFPKKTFGTVWMTLKTGVFTVNTVFFQICLIVWIVPLALMLYNHVHALTGTKKMLQPWSNSQRSNRYLITA